MGGCLLTSYNLCTLVGSSFVTIMFQFTLIILSYAVKPTRVEWLPTKKNYPPYKGSDLSKVIWKQKLRLGLSSLADRLIIGLMVSWSSKIKMNLFFPVIYRTIISDWRRNKLFAPIVLFFFAPIFPLHELEKLIIYQSCFLTVTVSFQSAGKIEKHLLLS